MGRGTERITSNPISLLALAVKRQRLFAASFPTRSSRGTGSGVLVSHVRQQHVAKELAEVPSGSAEDDRSVGGVSSTGDCRLPPQYERHRPGLGTDAQRRERCNWNQAAAPRWFRGVAVIASIRTFSPPDTAQGAAAYMATNEAARLVVRQTSLLHGIFDCRNRRWARWAPGRVSG